MRGPRSDSWARTGGWSLTGRGALSSVGPLTTYRGFGILAVPRARVGFWGVAKWQGTGFWSRDRRFESCSPSRGPAGVIARQASGRSSETMSQEETLSPIFAVALDAGKGTRMRSEERRVGKERRSWWPLN